MKIEDLHFSMPTQSANEENFDIEKWRHNHPMDYLKAIYLLYMTEGIVKNVTFDAIYRVTRLHIPDVLYKYYSLTSNENLNEQKFQTLQQGKIFMADIKTLNDPFDGKAFFYNAEHLKEVERFVPHNGKRIDDFTVFHKAASFTKNGVNSMPMWAHYSNNHEGFCVSYDMKKIVHCLRTLFPFSIPINV